MPEEKPQPVPLQEGQSFTAYIESGTHIVAWHGTIFVEPAGEPPLACAVQLPEGEAYLVESGGWLRLSAPSGGQFLLALPRPATAAWPMRFLQAMLGALHLPRRDWQAR